MDSDTRRELKISSGIDYILEHFRFQPYLFPRKIFTGIPARSKVINCKEEIFEHFKKSKFIDCWINGFPYVSISERSSKLQLLAPNIIYIDLDNYWLFPQGRN
jgi:hypothetical protein